MEAILRCPHCHGPLRRLGRAYRCPAGHSFDIARQGYANLLPVSRRHSRAPGDNREMILARRRFLERGFYDPVATALNRLAAESLPAEGGDGPLAALDAGAGEGFYLQRLQEALEAARPGREVWCYGVDVSRPAVQYATHRSKRALWLVASAVDLPFQDAAVDLLLSVFAPLAADEFGRLLRPGGRLLVAGPGPRHLAALRALLYREVRPLRTGRAEAALAAGFLPLAERRVAYTIELSSPQDIADLLTMTPYGWNIDKATRGRLAALPRLATPVDVLLRVFGRREAER